jgi:hypothetical protein
MKRAKIVLAGAAALAFLGSVALAQEGSTGTITRIDRINGTVSIQPIRSGTVGANTGTVGASTGGAAEQFKVQGGVSENLHAGDKVKFSVTETGGVKTITQLEKQ